MPVTADEKLALLRYFINQIRPSLNTVHVGLVFAMDALWDCIDEDATKSIKQAIEAAANAYRISDKVILYDLLQNGKLMLFKKKSCFKDMLSNCLKLVDGLVSLTLVYLKKCNSVHELESLFLL